MKNKKLNWLILFLVFAVNIGLDQGTKVLARQNLIGKGTVHVIDNLFILRYAENTGAFLSMGSNIPQPFKTIVLTVLPMLFLLGLLVYLAVGKTTTFFELVCLISVAAGGLSNLLDRILYHGAVTDFMNFGIGNIRTGILNVADLSITFGVILFLISQQIRESKEKKARELQRKEKLKKMQEQSVTQNDTGSLEG